MGGNNPRNEIENLEGEEGTTYKAKNRSNSAYKISENDISALTGVFDAPKSIYVYYNGEVEYIVRTLEQGTNDVLGSVITEKGFIGSVQEVVAPSIALYEPVEPVSVQKTLSEDKDNNVFEFYYTKIEE